MGSRSAVGSERHDDDNAVSTGEDNQYGDQLDFDEQGIGKASPPPTVGPLALLVIDRITPALAEPLPSLLNGFWVRSPEMPATPHFARVEKRSIVLLI